MLPPVPRDRDGNRGSDAEGRVGGRPRHGRSSAGWAIAPAQRHAHASKSVSEAGISGTQVATAEMRAPDDIFGGVGRAGLLASAREGSRDRI